MIFVDKLVHVRA